MKRLIAFKIIFLKDHPATCLLRAIIRQCQMNDHDRMISFLESRPLLVDDCIHCFQRWLNSLIAVFFHTLCSYKLALLLVKIWNEQVPPLPHGRDIPALFSVKRSPVYRRRPKPAGYITPVVSRSQRVLKHLFERKETCRLHGTTAKAFCGEVITKGQK